MPTRKAPPEDRLYQIPDRFCSLTEAAKALTVSRDKIKKLMQAQMLLWDHPKNARNPVIEVGSLMRIKYPEKEPEFKRLTVKDARLLQKEIDVARFKIASQAGLPPGAIKIFFDMGE